MKILRYMSIRTRMVLPIFIGIVILSAGLSSYFISTITSNGDRSLKDLAQRTVGILSHSLEYTVSTKNFDDSKLLIDWLIQQPDIYSIKISDHEKVILFEKRDEIIEEKYLQTYRQDIKLRTLQDSLTSNNDISLDTQNSSLNFQTIGHVEVVVSSLITEKEISEWLSGALIFALLLLIISISFALLTSHSTTTAIKTIIKSINKMAEGDLSSRIEIKQRREIGEIAGSFNKMADKVQHAESELVHANELQKRFMATMSHDLRSPLGIMLSMIELTIRGGKLAPHSKMHLSSGYSAGKQLLRLVDDVLDVGKIENGEEILNCVEFDLKKELFESIEVKRAIINKDIHLTFNFEDFKHDIKVVGDKNKILRIVNNLLGNSIKFTNAGCISIFCKYIDTKHDEIIFSFEIKDTGIGIPTQSIKSIFAPFKQGEVDTSVKYGGSGLGLSIVHEYCKMMQGEISVESKEGIGTKFIFNIPLQYKITPSTKVNIQHNNIVKIKKKNNNKSNTRNKNSDTNTNDVSVLMIDDNEDYIEIIKQYLTNDKFTIHPCTNGLDGIKHFKLNNVDIVLLDCQMPGLSGFDVSKEIRKYEHENGIQKTPILAVTANKTIDIEQKCHNAGMCKVLTKPFNKAELIENIAQLYSR